MCAMQDVLEWIMVKGKRSAMLINSSVLGKEGLHVCLDQANHKNESSGLMRVFSACLIVIIGMKNL